MLEDYHVLNVFLVKIKPLLFHNLRKELVNENNIVFSQQFFQVHFESFQMFLIRENVQIRSLLSLWWLRGIWAHRQIILDKVLRDWFVWVLIDYLYFSNFMNWGMFVISNRLQIAVVLPNNLRRKRLGQLQKILTFIILVSKHRQCVDDSICVSNHIFNDLKLIQHFVVVLILNMGRLISFRKIQWPFWWKVVFIIFFTFLIWFFIWVYFQFISLLFIFLKFLMAIYFLCLLVIWLFLFVLELWIVFVWRLKFVIVALKLQPWRLR